MSNSVPLVDREQREALIESLDIEVLEELIAAFWEDLPGQFDAIVAALDGREHGRAEQILHTIKGSGSSLGYAAVAAAAHELRRALRDHAPIALAVGDFCDVLRRSADADAMVVRLATYGAPADEGAARSAAA